MKKVWIAFLCTFFLLTLMYAEHVHSRIENAVLRLHVVADSNSKQDQAQKLKVRDFVLEKYGIMLTQSNKAKAVESVFSNLEQIEQDIKQKFNVPVHAELCRTDFPTKEYNGIVLPAGEYLALNIKLGKAKGENWWCVMYPPLCFSELSTETNKEKMKEVLSEKEYELVTSGTSEVFLKFKTVELWNKFKKMF